MNRPHPEPWGPVQPRAPMPRRLERGRLSDGYWREHDRRLLAAAGAMRRRRIAAWSALLLLAALFAVMLVEAIR